MKEKEKEKEKTQRVFDEKIKKQLENDKLVDKEILETFNPLDMVKGVFSSDETAEKDKIIEILFEHKDIRKIADITEKDLLNITVLLTFANEVNSPLIIFFSEALLTLSLSKDRASRKEIVEIYKSHMMEQGLFLNYPENKSRFGRLKDKIS